MDAFKPAEKKGRKYLNIVPTSVMAPGKTLDTLRQYFFSKEEAVPKKKPGPFITDADIYKTSPVSGLRVTWFGHSSLLIESDGLRILTDPVWSDRVSFSPLIGPKRFFSPPLPLDLLPIPDAIIISHNHYDHLDKATILKLAPLKIAFYCSEGVGKHLVKWGVDANLVTEMNWGNQRNIAGKGTLTATPARHFSGRGIIRNETLWSSFIIKTARHNLFFGADSGWFDEFEKIGNAFGPFDLTMLEIGAYHSNWPDIHMGPGHATNAHLALKGKLMLPIHWGTFNLALHAWKEPVEKLMQFAKEKNIQLLLPSPGQPVEINGTAYNSHWWEERGTKYKR